VTNAIVSMLTAALMLGACGAASAAEPATCGEKGCPIGADGAYPHLIIGKLVSIGGEQDMVQVKQWAKANGYWKHLPEPDDSYARTVRAATIAVATAQGTKHMTVFMQKEELNTDTYRAGDLVRYSPHNYALERPQGNAQDMALFRGLTGCVATLCRQADRSCDGRHPQGVYTKAQGNPVDPDTGAALKQGVTIDPQTLLVRTSIQ
jgi:hypothetical protein